MVLIIRQLNDSKLEIFARQNSLSNFMFVGTFHCGHVQEVNAFSRITPVVIVSDFRVHFKNVLSASCHRKGYFALRTI